MTFGLPVLDRVGPWTLRLVTHTTTTAGDTQTVGTWGWWPDKDVPAALRSMGRDDVDVAMAEVVATFTDRLRVVEVRNVGHIAGDLPRAVFDDLARHLHRLGARQHSHGTVLVRDDGRWDDLEPRQVEATRHLTTWTPEHLAQVAEVYVNGGTRGRRAVADKYALSLPGAGHQIDAAVAAGLLVRTSSAGRSGGRLTAKARRILKGGTS